MNKTELGFINLYAHKLNDGGGDLASLTKEERDHLKALMQMHELELKLDKMADDLTQLPLPE